MREVADLAGVGLSSVSRVLSDHPDVSREMRERVLLAVERLGYEPDIVAQSMRLQRTKLIGFVAGDISNPLLAEIVKGAETALREAGFSMLLANSENDPALDAENIRLFVRRRVDGLILSLASEEHLATLDELRVSELPVVVLDRDISASLRASAVLSDHRAGMRAAVEHLLDLGHRRIGLILGQPVRFSRERRHGLEEAYAARALPHAYSVVEGQLADRHGREATRRLLDEEDPPTAIVAGGNQLLAGVLSELMERRLDAGRDLSIVSCDAVNLTEFFSPPIAVIRRDTRLMGARAADLLLERVVHDGPPRQLVLPTEFVPRPSCAPPPSRRAPRVP